MDVVTEDLRYPKGEYTNMEVEEDTSELSSHEVSGTCVGWKGKNTRSGLGGRDTRTSRTGGPEGGALVYWNDAVL